MSDVDFVGRTFPACALTYSFSRPGSDGWEAAFAESRTGRRGLLRRSSPVNPAGRGIVRCSDWETRSLHRVDRIDWLVMVDDGELNERQRLCGVTELAFAATLPGQPKHPELVVAVAATADLRRLAVLTACRWHPSGGELVLVDSGQRTVHGVSHRMGPAGGSLRFDGRDGRLLSATGPAGGPFEPVTASSPGRFATLTAWLPGLRVPAWRYEVETRRWNAWPLDGGVLLTVNGRHVAACPRWCGTPVVAETQTGNIVLRADPEGLLERYLRVPIRAVALSHDGRWLARALYVPDSSWREWRIELVDLGSGQISSVLPLACGHPTEPPDVLDLAFAPDGTALLVAGNVGDAPRVWLVEMSAAGLGAAQEVWRGTEGLLAAWRHRNDLPLMFGDAEAVWPDSGPRVLFTGYDRPAVVDVWAGRLRHVALSLPDTAALTSDGRFVLTATPDAVCAWPVDASATASTVRTVPMATEADLRLTTRQRLETLLDGRPTAEAWQEVCRLLDDLDDLDVAAVTPKVVAWPGRIRQMPDRWWTDQQHGRPQARLRLAGCRLVELASDLDVVAVACASGAVSLLVGTAHPDRDGGGISLWSIGEYDGGGAQPGPVVLFASGDCFSLPSDVMFSPDGALLAVAAEDEARPFVVVYDPVSGQALWTHGRPTSPETDTPVDEWQVLDTADVDINAVFGDIDISYDQRGQLRMVGSGGTGLAFSADGRLLAYTVRHARRVMVAPAATGENPIGLELPRASAGAVALDASGNLVAAPTHDGLIRVWHVPSGRLLRQYHCGLHDPRALAFSPDGAHLAAAGTHLHRDEPQPFSDPAGTPCLSVLPLDEPTNNPQIRSLSDPRLPASGVRVRRAHLSWTDQGLRTYWSGSGLAVLADGLDGNLRWASRSTWDDGWTPGSISPDGRFLVTADDRTRIWFLDHPL